MIKTNLLKHITFIVLQDQSHEVILTFVHASACQFWATVIFIEYCNMEGEDIGRSKLFTLGSTGTNPGLYGFPAETRRCLTLRLKLNCPDPVMLVDIPQAAAL